MARVFLIITTVALILSGCATAPSPPAGGRGRFAWDGLGQDPNSPVNHKRRRVAAISSLAAVQSPDPNGEREKVLATLRPYSTAWWAVQDAIDAEEQKRLNAKLVICRTCLRPSDRDEFTGSVRP